MDDPHEYILQILYPINGGLAYGPGTGFVGRLFYDLGIPFRLGIEAVFLMACVLVLKALFAWPWRNWLSLGLFVLMTFDPAIAELFSHFYSDQVWMIETMIAFSCIVLAFRPPSRPNWILLNIAALLLGLSALTRSVFLPLIGGLVTFAFLAGILLLLKNREARRKKEIGTLALSMATWLLLIGAVYEGACIYNLRAHGYNGISAIDSAEFKKFYFCLQSVGEPTGKPYFPIDQDRRELIAKAGITSKWFMEEMDPTGYFRKVGMEHYGTADIASGWLEFALFNEAYRGSDGDLRNCFALFKTIENEIATAGDHGVFKVRPILPLPDSRVAIVAKVFPRALHTTLGEIAFEPSSADLILNPHLHYDDRDFTVALNRRVVHESPARDLIWFLLCGVYRAIYTSYLVYAYLISWLLFLIVFVIKWSRIESLSLHWVGQQLFGLFFIVLLFWYALFDASGWPALSRYMIFNHVMLPILLIYYLTLTRRLLRDEHLEREEHV